MQPSCEQNKYVNYVSSGNKTLVEIFMKFCVFVILKHNWVVFVCSLFLSLSITGEKQVLFRFVRVNHASGRWTSPHVC